MVFGWSLVFFSVAGCKRAVYILPALPPLALALGCYVDVLVAQQKKAFSWAMLVRQASRLATYASALVLVCGLGVVLLATYKEMLPSTPGLAFGGLAVALAATFEAGDFMGLIGIAGAAVWILFMVAGARAVGLPRQSGHPAEDDEEKIG